ncbi:6-bladed beta-propeller [Roseivirga ehrenbergii]|nr:6-bladed beta-propeller [Roseivirga ehrenbergii]
MKLRFGILMLLLGLMVSCSSGNEQKQTEQAVATDEFKTFKIDTEAKAVSIFELIEEVEVMRLEETAESLLSSVFKVSSTEDRIIFPSGNDGSIYSYSKEGEFISKFSHVGNGPGEYEFIWSFWVDGDRIFVSDINRRRLLSYDLEGNHLRSWKLPFSAKSFFTYDKGFVADLDYTAFQDSLQFNVLFLDENMEVKQMANPYLSPLILYVGSSVNSFQPYGKDLIYHGFKSDSVFLIEKNQVRPLLKFDFGEEWLWTEETIKNNPRTTGLIRETDLVWWVDSYINEKWIYLSYKTSFKDVFKVLIDRMSGIQKTVKVNKGAATKYAMTPIKWEEDRFMVSLQSPDVRAFINDLGEEKVKFRQGTTLEEIESSENPVLLWVKFKELK